MSDHDLQLATAALARDPVAVRELDAMIRDAASSAARRLGGDAATADDIAQRLAEKMWIGRAQGRPALATYTGEAPLRAWLKIIAYRDGVELLRAREVPDDGELVDRVMATTEPELAMLRASYLAAFKRCFAAAFAGLSMHDRDLVRRHYLDGLTLDQLATFHDCHRATIARTIARVRERLVADTREALRRELSANTDLDEVLAVIASKLEASLSRET